MRKNSLIRIDSEAVQGPESFVVLRRPTWKMMRAATKAQGEGPISDEEMGMIVIETIMPDLIVDWNWAKETEEGELTQLPIPSTKPSVMDELDFEEVMFLIEKITPLLNAKSDRPN